MQKFLLFFLGLYTCTALQAFEMHSVTPNPVVGYQEIAFFDKEFNTSRNVLVWYPVDAATQGTISKSPWDIFQVASYASVSTSQKNYPVIVLSHGYTGNPHQLSWLILELVHHQYIVIAIQHMDLIDGKAHINHWQRARDVTTILDQFTGSKLAASANLEAIGVAGFSLGGTTAVWSAGGRATKLNSLIPSKEFASPEDYTKADEALPTLNKEMMSKNWSDQRVKAAFIMAPAWSWLFDEINLNKISIPTYFIAASEDQVLVTKNGAGYFARNIPKALYLEIPGKANHYIFISAMTDVQKKKADPKAELNFLFEDDVTIDRRWIQEEVSEEAVRFFDSFLRR